MTECCICLEHNSQFMITTDCDHNFHKKCFEKYVKNKKNKITCPICRSNIIYKSIYTNISFDNYGIHYIKHNQSCFIPIPKHNTLKKIKKND